MQIKTGSFTGAGAAKNVSLGFKPLFVFIQNVTDGTTLNFYVDPLTGTDPTGSIDIDAAVGPVTDAGGITHYAGDSNNAQGFSVDAGNAVNAKTYAYVALGE